MQKPTRVTFHGLPVDDEIQARCLAEAGKLEQFFAHITSCHVTITAPPQHRQKGAQYSVRVDLAVPGDELVINREPGTSVKPGDLHSAIHDAFDRARRVLEDYARRLRGDVKQHERRASS